MSKVVFWSPVHGQTAVTSNILIIVLLCAMLYKKRCLITQTHFNFNNLEAPLVESNVKSATDYFTDVGIDALIRRFKAEKIDKKVIESCCISIPKTNISLLPGTAKTNRDAFEDEVGLIAPRLLREIEKYYDYVFVDASPSINELSSKLMDEAGAVVVNLSQNINITDVYFNEFKKIAKKDNVFYLFGSYDGNSKYNINNIRRKYKLITVKNSGVIPYNTGYKDALIESKVIDYVRKNKKSAFASDEERISSDKPSDLTRDIKNFLSEFFDMSNEKVRENEYFMMKAASAAEKILQMAECHK